MAYPIRVLDLDHSLSPQKNLFSRFHPYITDLTRLGPWCRLWAGKKQAQELRTVLQKFPAQAIAFLGSGDFHHISRLLIERFSDSLSVIIFDHHPDWDILVPKFACGSWVSRILEMPNIKKVILVGVASDDIGERSIYTGNLKALKHNRLEIYPYSRKATGIIFNRKIQWQQLNGNDLNDFFLEITKRIPTEKVYISIDKDCLNSEFALTNWEEGALKLGELELMLKLVKEKFDILGADITGEYSPVILKGWLKNFCSRLDHPKDYSAKGRPQELIDQVNESTNIRLLEALV